MMSSAGLRLRKRPLKEIVKDFDAFPKVEPSAEEEKRVSGGAILLFSVSVIIWLVIGELRYYSQIDYDYKFIVDTDFDTKLEFNVDITVNNPCALISADISDSTDQALPFMYGELKSEPADFELDDSREVYFQILKDLKPLRLRFQLLDDLILWKLSINKKILLNRKNVGKLQNVDASTLIRNSALVELLHHHTANAERPSPKRGDACRIHGTVKVNKIAGNFHITPGISLPIVGGGHAHLTIFGVSTNFSHRIDKFSFGSADGVQFVNPLDGTEKITEGGTISIAPKFTLLQYYIKIVPTKIVYPDGATVKTCQYALTQRHRAIDHSKGSHGMPGINFRYDMSSVMIEIRQRYKSTVELLMRLSALIGGIYATAGLFSSILSFTINCLFCRKRTRSSDANKSLLISTKNRAQIKKDDELWDGSNVLVQNLSLLSSQTLLKEQNAVISNGLS
uniref:Endoplasmic reticulum-Golgi intermediate compartment protein 2 n=1 Tax=Romanomermis culicivorax TaxID=13658 RepID=A0A915IZP8_ROMCU